MGERIDTAAAIDEPIVDELDDGVPGRLEGYGWVIPIPCAGLTLAQSFVCSRGVVEEVESCGECGEGGCGKSEGKNDGTEKSGCE